jgi:hypothetical protein
VPQNVFAEPPHVDLREKDQVRLIGRIDELMDLVSVEARIFQQGDVAAAFPKFRFRVNRQQMNSGHFLLSARSTNFEHYEQTSQPEQGVDSFGGPTDGRNECLR